MDLGIGVIGAGVMGAEHARILRRAVSGAHLAGVCDRDPARAAAAAGDAPVFSDPLALIAAPEVAAVVIASPDETHAEYALACLAAGKPALLEKPMAHRAAEALRIVEAEAAGGRRLVQLGFMRRYDAAYGELKAVLGSGRIGRATVLHNVHRNVSVPDWFSGPMAITNSFSHEIDISRWLLGAEITSAQVFPAGDRGLLMVTMRTDGGQVVSTEVNINAGYGYHVHAQIVGEQGTVEMAPPGLALTNAAGAHGFDFPADWIPRFAQAYRDQMQGWVDGIAAGRLGGATAWDGYVTVAVAEQIAASLPDCQPVEIALPPRPEFYR